jgi:hypothetical protein
VTRFIDHFNKQVVTTGIYNAIVNLHILQINTAHAIPSQTDFTSRFPVTNLNNGYSSASVLTSFLSGEYATSELLLQLTNSQAGCRHTPTSSSSQTDLQLSTSKLVSGVTSLHGLRRKHRFLQFLYCCAWTRCGNQFVSLSLPSNGSTRDVSIPSAF